MAADCGPEVRLVTCHLRHYSRFLTQEAVMMVMTDHVVYNRQESRPGLYRPIPADCLLFPFAQYHSTRASPSCTRGTRFTL
jgi:hypothetical protein